MPYIMCAPKLLPRTSHVINPVIYIEGGELEIQVNKLIPTIAHFLDAEYLVHTPPHTQNASMPSTRGITPKLRILG